MAIGMLRSASTFLDSIIRFDVVFFMLLTGVAARWLAVDDIMVDASAIH